jgi:ribosomal protein L9
VDVEERAIVIEEPIKELGIYELKVQLAPEIEAVTKLWVVEEE